MNREDTAERVEQAKGSLLQITEWLKEQQAKQQPNGSQRPETIPMGSGGTGGNEHRRSPPRTAAWFALAVA